MLNECIFFLGYGNQINTAGEYRAWSGSLHKLSHIFLCLLVLTPSLLKKTGSGTQTGIIRLHTYPGALLPVNASGFSSHMIISKRHVTEMVTGFK